MAHELDDHAIFEAVESPNSPHGHVPRVTTPAMVLHVPDKNELQELLKMYGHPFIKHVTPDDPFARRWHVEKVRPALRFYCQKFGVTVPDYLKNDDHWKNLPDEEKQELFGTTKLRIREFRPINYNTGITARQQ